MFDRLPKTLRDSLSARIFRLTSMRLRHQLPFSDPRRLVLNTCSVAPHIPTIAHWADWRLSEYGFSGDLSKQPRIVFVKGRSDHLSVFFASFLPRIKPDTRFVLITGDCDHTMPKQLDRRYESNETAGLADALEALRNDPRLIHWYAQNLDTTLSKMSAMPLGYIEGDGNRIYQAASDNPHPIRLRDRPLKVLCAHRIRQGPQWQKRRDVSALIADHWGSFVDHPDNIAAEDFAETIARYPFVLCVGGGGLDPSPKAWAALIAGSIPIVERNATTAVYGELPVAFVDEWHKDCLDIARLERWVDELYPHFEDPTLRAATLARMSMGAWLLRVEEQLAHAANAVVVE